MNPLRNPQVGTGVPPGVWPPRLTSLSWRSRQRRSQDYAQRRGAAVHHGGRGGERPTRNGMTTTTTTSTSIIIITALDYTDHHHPSSSSSASSSVSRCFLTILVDLFGTCNRQHIMVVRDRGSRWCVIVYS